MVDNWELGTRYFGEEKKKKKGKILTLPPFWTAVERHCRRKMVLSCSDHFAVFGFDMLAIQCRELSRCFTSEGCWVIDDVRLLLGAVLEEGMGVVKVRVTNDEAERAKGFYLVNEFSGKK